jgi:uncharacterized membrane protein
VRALGLAAFVLLRATAAPLGEWVAWPAPKRRSSRLPSAAYLLWAQLGPIGAICQWCLAGDAIVLTLTVLSVVRALREQVPAPVCRDRSGRGATRLAIAGRAI